MESDYTLLTGVTGLLGRYLLRDLLRKGRRLAVVVRPSAKQTVMQRVEEILQFWEIETGEYFPRPVVIEGDITETLLGLSAADLGWVKRHCSAAMHSAASLTFHNDSRGEPDRSNIGGVENMLELCREAGITEFHYVSTAYVAGHRRDLVLENELQAGNAFRNDYERSKFEAEQRVRSADFIKDLTVYRPAVIAGDSKTGYTNTYHGLYLYLKLMSVLVRNTAPGPDGVRDTPVQFDLTGEEERNIITVDWVSEVICDLFDNPEAHGQTYHLAPEVPLTPRRIIEAGYTYYNSRGVIFTGSQTSTDREPISEIDRNTHENISMYREYEVSDPKFDLTNLRKYAGHIPCPVIDEPMIHRFLRYGETDRWGKRRVSHRTNCASVEQHCGALVSKATRNQATEPTLVNMRVLGPGGGDWVLAIEDDELVSFERGWDSQARASFEITSEVFWSLNVPQDDFDWQEFEQLLTVEEQYQEATLTQLGNALFGASSAPKPSNLVDRPKNSLV